MKKEDLFRDAGLSTNEALVYKTLIEHTKLPVKELIKKTKLKRGNLYNILYSLEEKKLIEEFDYQKIKHFRALSPKRLREIVVEKRNNLRQVTVKLDEMLPGLLKEFQTSSEKPGVYYYNGLEGLRHVYEKILNEKHDLYVFVSDFERNDPEVDKMINKQIKKQYKAGIKVKAISAHDYHKKHLESLNKMNSFPKVIDSLKLDSEILVFGDNVAITTFRKDYFTTLIINKQIAQTLKCIFKVLYATARKPKLLKDKKTKEFKIKINYNK